MKKIKEMKKLRSTTKSKNKKKTKVDKKALGKVDNEPLSNVGKFRVIRPNPVKDALLSNAIDKMLKYRSCCKGHLYQYKSIDTCTIRRLKTVQENIKNGKSDENPKLCKQALRYACTALRNLRNDPNPDRNRIQALAEGIDALQKFSDILQNEKVGTKALDELNAVSLSKAIKKIEDYRICFKTGSSHYVGISQYTIQPLKTVQENIKNGPSDENSELCRKALQYARRVLKTLSGDANSSNEEIIQTLKARIKKADVIQTLEGGIKELEKFSDALQNQPKIDKVDKFSEKVAKEESEGEHENVTRSIHEQEEKSLLSSEQPCEFFSQNTDKKLLLNFDENPLIGNTPFDLRINQDLDTLPAPFFLPGKKAEDAQGEEGDKTEKVQMGYDRLSQSDKDEDERSSFSLSNGFINRKRQGSGVLFEEFYAGSRKHY